MGTGAANARNGSATSLWPDRVRCLHLRSQFTRVRMRSATEHAVQWR